MLVLIRLFPAPLSKSAVKQEFPILIPTLGGLEVRTLFTRCWGFELIPPFGPTVLSVESSFPNAAGYPASSVRFALQVVGV